MASSALWAYIWDIFAPFTIFTTIHNIQNVHKANLHKNTPRNSEENIKHEIILAKYEFDASLCLAIPFSNEFSQI